MRTALLVISLLAVPAFADVLPGQQVSRLTLAADDDVTRDAPPADAKRLALPPPPSSPDASFGLPDPSLSLQVKLLEMEMRLLNNMKDSVAAPMVLSIIGGAGALTAIGFMLLGVSNYSFFIVGLVMAMVSGGPLLIGLPWLFVALAQNARINAQVQKLEEERRHLAGISLSAAPLEVPMLRLASF